MVGERAAKAPAPKRRDLGGGGGLLGPLCSILDAPSRSGRRGVVVVVLLSCAAGVA